MPNWWYQDGAQKSGPVQSAELKRLLSRGAISPRTVAWKEGTTDSRPLCEFEDFAGEGLQSPENSLRSVDSLRATAWPRFFARHFDLYWEMLFLSAVGGFVLSPFPGIARWVKSDYGYLLFVIIIPFALTLDALVHGVFRTTPGKRLLRLAVEKSDGRRLSTGAHLLRNIHLWASGFAFGFPILSLGSYYFQWTRLARGVPASYDAVAEIRVVAKRMSGGRKLSVGLAFVGTWAFFTAALIEERQLTARILEAHASRKTASWENPVTGKHAKIDQRWRSSPQRASDGQPLFIFTEPRDEVIVILAKEKFDQPLKSYVLAFQKATASTMHFADEGRFVDYGRPAWVGLGTFQMGRIAGRVNVQIAQYGSAFWRVVTIRALQDAVPAEMVAGLQSELWSTVE